MDKEQIANIIRSNPGLSYPEMKKQALEAGVALSVFEEAWREARKNNPADHPADHATETKLKIKSVATMIFLTSITMGLYIPIWFLKQKEGLNSLNSKMKIGNMVIPIILILCLASISLIFAPLLLLKSGNSIAEIKTTLENFQNYQSWCNFFTALAILKVTFDSKRILSDHFKTTIPGIWAFFFTVYYLQFKINQLIKGDK